MRASAARLVLLVLPSVVTLAALSATVATALAAQERTIREATTERVLEVASSLADLPEVREAVTGAMSAGSPSVLADAADLAPATAILQPIAELVGEAAGVYYVVITDDEGVRITHPLASERGVQVETANASVLAGETFVGTEVGASGPSLRAKVPVRGSDGTPIGMVAVGVLESQIAGELDEAVGALLPWAIGALVVATLASSILTAAVERRFRRLDVIAAEHAQMRRTATALREQSHEFSTRLHVIHGLLSRGDTDEARGYIEDIASVRRPLGTGDDGARDDQPVLAAMIPTVRAELHEIGARVRFDLDIDDDIDEGVVSVVSNLCRNAAEAGAANVICELGRRGSRIVGSVDDDGPGVEPRVARRIFAPGYSSKTDTTGLGRGLGLDVVRRIVTARSGSVEVGRSALGGARFAFELEAAR
ncbi:ATP-binding protein [Microbacterium sp. NE2HP2]|uniref:sensor histidine kinase n=1 Tax=Microbacterium TaxID=33882 RepID=UPI002366B2EC|nr:ATP-binding protein [Microbacterium plantarum]MDD7944836.1 ATP-binding protein [Microbacterium plantarum]WRK16338.1 ATP-binding protein [Microbacterium plantarum]